jgi:transposase
MFEKINNVIRDILYLRIIDKKGNYSSFEREKEIKLSFRYINRVHKTKLIEKIAEILNINLIFLPPYSPDLNPIEDIWRKNKD